MTDVQIVKLPLFGGEAGEAEAACVRLAALLTGGYQKFSEVKARSRSLHAVLYLVYVLIKETAPLPDPSQNSSPVDVLAALWKDS